jgi:hypothetical protein
MLCQDERKIARGQLEHEGLFRDGEAIHNLLAIESRYERGY